jgi:excisionase family DNA binding protein
MKRSPDIKGSKKIKERSKERVKSTENEKTKQTYSTQELSEILGKAERTLREWAEEGKIPAIRVGKRWRFPKEEVDILLSKRKDGAFETSQLEEKEELPKLQKGDFVPENEGEPGKDI